MEASGPPPEGDVDKGAALIIGGSVTVAVATLFVALRFCVRIWITKSVWWDDWTILFAIIGNIIGLALDFVEIHYGFGRPQFYLNQHQLLEYGKYAYGEWIQTFATLMWTKVSICLFLIRIPVTKALIRPLQGAVIFLVVSNVVLTLLWILQCRPVAAAWDTSLQPHLCFTRGQLERIIISQAIISVVSDFVFASYPILILWKVQMKLSTKVSLCCLMGIGVFTGACCIVRTVLNYQAVARDKTFGGIDNWFWRLFEIQIGIMAACAPALRPGYKWLHSRIKTIVTSRGQHKLTDEVPLNSVERKLPYNREKRSSGSFGNETSIERGWAPPVVPADKIRKTTDFEIGRK